MGNDCLNLTLADVSSDVSYGYTESATKERIGPRFLRITDIQNGTVDWSAVPYCPISEGDLEKYKLELGDIVVARTGNSTGENYIFESDEKAVFASYLIRFKIAPEKAFPRYVWYSMRSKRWWAFINGSKTGSAQPGANAKVLGRFPLRLPSFPDQRTIVHILGSLDDKIELNRQMNRTLEKMAQAIFKSWFVDFDPVRAKAEGRDTGLPKETAGLFPDSFEESELGEIPTGWEVGCVGEFANVISGKRPQKRSKEKSGEFTIPLYGGGGIMAYVQVPMISVPFLLTGRVGTLGKIFRITEDCWPSDNTLLLFPNDKSYLDFLYFILQRIDFNSLNRGSTQPLVTQTDLKNQKIVVPKDDILFFYWQNVQPMFEKIDKNIAEFRTLASLRDTLLPKLISGELPIPDAEKILEGVE